MATPAKKGKKAAARAVPVQWRNVDRAFEIYVQRYSQHPSGASQKYRKEGCYVYIKVHNGLQTLENLKKSCETHYKSKISGKFTIDILATDCGPSCTHINHVGTNKEHLKIRVLLHPGAQCKPELTDTNPGETELGKDLTTPSTSPRVSSNHSSINEGASTSGGFGSKRILTKRHVKKVPLAPSKMMKLGNLCPHEEHTCSHGTILLS